MADTVTFERLRAAVPGRWRSAAAAWRGLADWAGRRADELAAHAAELRAAWSGAAARAADARLASARCELAACRVGWWEVDQVLSLFAAEVDRARALLDAAVTTAGASGLVVDPAGRVSAGPSLDPRCRAATVTAATAAIRAAVAVAARADAEAAQRLAEVASTGPGDLVAAPPPLCGAGPAAVRRWWDGLSAAQRRWFTVTQPALVGSLDGVPVEARDRANRLRLADQRAALDRELASADGRARRRLLELRAGLELLTDRLASAGPPRAYLLGLELAGDGRAIVALGDPDRADNVLTHVPGMTADLATVDGELSRAGLVAERAGRLAPGERTAAVLWLGYDAPDFIDEAAGSGRAREGAPELRRFQEGLRVTHQGPAAHQAVLGHSYGSLVVGTAARQGLAADSIVFVGSPGVGVDSAAELRTAGQVWSTTSRTDVIQYTALAPAGFLADVVRSAALPILGPVLEFGLPEDDLWHGRNPSAAGFGARVFTSQPSAGHVGYWATDGPALDNLAGITLGGEYQGRVR